MSKWSSFDLVEGFQLAKPVAALHELDLFKAMQRPATVKSNWPARCSVDANLLSGVMEYVAARTDLLRKERGRFQATHNYAEKSRFLLDLDVGAYGRNAQQLPDLLRDASLASKSVDGVRHARAFAGVKGSQMELLPSLIVQLGFTLVA